MNTRIVRPALFALIAAPAFLLPALGQVFSFSYSDSSNAGTGSLVVSGGNAVSGSFTVTTGSMIGIWNLTPGSGQTPPLFSGVYMFYDNKVNPSQNPSLTSGGLMFSNGSGSYVNLYSNAASDYSFLAFKSGESNYATGANGSLHGGFSLTQVPEPATEAAFVACGLLAFGAFRLRRKQA